MLDYIFTNCSLNSVIICARDSMSALDTLRILGSTGRFSRISCGFAWLLRFDNGVAKGVPGLRGERGAEGIKTRLDTFSPVGKIDNGVGCGVVGTDGETGAGWFSVVEFESSDSGSVEVVGDSMDVFELIIHSSALFFRKFGFNFYKIENKWEEI